LLVLDDSSKDRTFEKKPGSGRRPARESPFSAARFSSIPVNQGYGGNQKIGYSLRDSNADSTFVALLHGDGQYAPEWSA